MNYYGEAYRVLQLGQYKAENENTFPQKALRTY